MAANYKHKRYFRCISDSDSSAVTFTAAGDWANYIKFNAAFNTSSPTKTYALEDSNKTLVITYEFDTADQETAFKNAVDAVWNDSTSPYVSTLYEDSTDFFGYFVEHFKTVWLHKDGSVSATDIHSGPETPGDFFS